MGQRKVSVLENSRGSQILDPRSAGCLSPVDSNVSTLGYVEFHCKERIKSKLDV